MACVILVVDGSYMGSWRLDEAYQEFEEMKGHCEEQQEWGKLYL